MPNVLLLCGKVELYGDRSERRSLSSCFLSSLSPVCLLALSYGCSDSACYSAFFRHTRYEWPTVKSVVVISFLVGLDEDGRLMVFS